MGRLVLLLIVGLWITSCKTDTQTSPAKPEASEKTAAKKSLPKQNKVPTTKPDRLRPPAIEITLKDK